MCARFFVQLHCCRLLFIFAVLSLAWGGVATSCVADDMSTELAVIDTALAAGDYETAYGRAIPIAESGDPLTQFTVALMYRNGWGRAADSQESCRWFSRAAKGKIPAAAHFFADCLSTGVLPETEPGEAVTWYRVAAELGHVVSLCSLADLYMLGQGVEKDPAMALSLCRRAAEAKSVPAMIHMGRLLLDGDAAVQDRGQAKAWFEHAAQYEAPEAEYLLGTMLRDEITDTITLERSRQWLERAAGHGHHHAYFPTAELYLLEPLEEKSGILPAAALAKAYLWLSAAVRMPVDEDSELKAREVLDAVVKMMPQSWRTELDAKVEKHMQMFAVQ